MTILAHVCTKKASLVFLKFGIIFLLHSNPPHSNNHGGNVRTYTSIPNTVPGQNDQHQHTFQAHFYFFPGFKFDKSSHPHTNTCVHYLLITVITVLLVDFSIQYLLIDVFVQSLVMLLQEYIIFIITVCKIYKQIVRFYLVA